MVRSSTRLSLILLIAAVATVKIFLQWSVPGFLQGDDVETMEAAFRAAFGLVYDDWEIRSHLLSELVVAPALRAASLIPGLTTDGLLLAGSLPFVLAGALATILVFRLAIRWGLSEGEALAAAALYALHAIPVVYGIGGFPRALVTPLILGAALLAGSHRALALLAAGAFLGLAGAARYSEWMFVLPLLATVLIPKGARASRAAGAIIGFLAGAVVVGTYDAISGEGAFSSLIEFVLYTTSGASSSVQASQPPWWYLARLHQWLPITAVPLLVWGWRRWRSNAAVWIAIPLVALSIVHHKELRYLQNVVPFLAIAIAAGLRRPSLALGPLPGSSELDADPASGGRAARDAPATVWDASGVPAAPVLGASGVPAAPVLGASGVPAAPVLGASGVPAAPVLGASGVRIGRAPLVLLALTIVWAAWGVNRLDRRTSSAVAAARAIAAEEPSVVAFAQAWAYGNHLYVRPAHVVDLPVAPGPADLERAREAEFVALYASTVTPELRERLGELGFGHWREVRAGGRAVDVFRKNPGSRSGWIPPRPSASASPSPSSLPWTSG